MDVLRGCGVTAAMREAAERGAAPPSAAGSPRNAATAPLNPFTPEFVVGAPAPPSAAGSPRNAATAPLNPFAPEFVVGAPAPPSAAGSSRNNSTTTPLNTLAPEFVVAAPAPTEANSSRNNATTTPLNPLAPEFVVAALAPTEANSSRNNATTTPLNPLAPEFVITTPAPTEANSPRNNATTTPLNPLAPDFVVPAPAPPPDANHLNPDATEFLPRRRRGGARELSADAPEFDMTAGTFLVYALPMIMGFPICPYNYNNYDYNNNYNYDYDYDYDYNYGNGAFQAQQQSWPTPPESSTIRRRTVNFSQQGRFRSSYGVRRIQREHFVRKTIYVTNIDNTVTEEMLAQLFGSCGTVVDCRVCGDPTSMLRFAFIEFQYWEDACAAQHLDGFTVGQFPLKIMPSRTAIMPINPSFLPQSEEEKELCSRTVYCSNIEKTVTEAELKGFCEEHFGSVSRVRLIGGDDHITGVAFVEFTACSAAAAALNSIGLKARGNLIRVSPSKTPIRITNDKRRRRRREICSSSSAHP